MESRKHHKNCFQTATISLKMCFVICIVLVFFYTSYAESARMENITNNANGTPGNGPVNLTADSVSNVSTSTEEKSDKRRMMSQDSGKMMDKTAHSENLSGIKSRPERSVPQTDPKSNHTDTAKHQIPPFQFDAAGMIAPTITLGHEQSIFPSTHADMELYESPAEQRDDEVEEIMEILHRRGYTHTVLPENMSLYPDLMNYTEPAEGPEDDMEGPEDDEQEDEAEAGGHLVLMTASVNGSDLVGTAEEFKAGEGLQPSGSTIYPMKVHSMSEMASQEYDPYYNYGYKYHPQKNSPHEQINPTPVLGRPSRTGNENVTYLPSTNGSAGFHQKIMDKKEVKAEKTADFSGMSASATFAIIVGSVIGFWMVVGPIICLVTRYRDKRKEKQKRFLLGPRQGQGQGEKGIMEAMIMTELGKLPFKKKKVVSVPVVTDPPSERQSLVEDRDTYHDAYDTPALLSGII